MGGVQACQAGCHRRAPVRAAHPGADPATEFSQQGSGGWLSRAELDRVCNDVLSKLYIYTNTHINTYTYTHIYTYTQIYTYTHVHIYTYTHMYVCYMRARVCVCVGILPRKHFQTDENVEPLV